jgi:hypothetical protein
LPVVDGRSGAEAKPDRAMSQRLVGRRLESRAQDVGHRDDADQVAVRRVDDRMKRMQIEANA